MQDTQFNAVTMIRHYQQKLRTLDPIAESQRINYIEKEIEELRCIIRFDARQKQDYLDWIALAERLRDQFMADECEEDWE